MKTYLETVYKRDGKQVPFDENKIRNAIQAAIKETYPNINQQSNSLLLNRITLSVLECINSTYKTDYEHGVETKVTVDDINDIVETVLMSECEWFAIYQSFSQYRRKRERVRLSTTQLMHQIRNLGRQTDRDNANVGNNFSSKMLRIGSEANKVCNLANISKKSAKLHENCDGHIHDLDSYNLTINCLHIPTKKLLRDGFNTGYGKTNSPKSIGTAASLSCIMLQVSQNDMFGGQAHPNFDADLAPYLGKTRLQIIFKQFCRDRFNQFEEEQEKFTQSNQLTLLKYNYSSDLFSEYLKTLEQNLQVPLPYDYIYNIDKIFFDNYKTHIDHIKDLLLCDMDLGTILLDWTINVLLPMIADIYALRCMINAINYIITDEDNIYNLEDCLSKEIIDELKKCVSYEDLIKILGDTFYNFHLKGFCQGNIKEFFNKIFNDNNSCNIIYDKCIVNYLEYNKYSVKYTRCIFIDALLNIQLYICRLQDKSIISNRVVITDVDRELHQAMQSVVYNLNTMHSRAGSQVPFSSVNIGIPQSEFEFINKDTMKICRVFLEEYDKGLGNGEQPIFPNIIYRVKSGINLQPDDKYVDVTKFATEVTARRMNPTYLNLDAVKYRSYVSKGIYPSMMGCRTEVLTNVNGEATPVGRGNIAPYTINLVRLGILASLESKCQSEAERIEYFFQLLDEQLDNAKDVLSERYEVLKGLKVKDLPFVVGEGLMVGSEKIKSNPNASIEPVLKQGTYAIGFIGLAETLMALIGEHHGQSEKAQKLGIEIIGHMRDYTDFISQTCGLTFGLYATPAEGLSSRFTESDRKKFGVICGVTDKIYYTNSFHVPVKYSISSLDKLRIETPYHFLCNSGHISYIEVDSYPNPEALSKILFKIFREYPNLEYFGVNFHSKQCMDCGTYLASSEQKCGNCHSENIRGVSRVTGYLSLDEKFGTGKTAERKDRVIHETGGRGYCY